MNRIPITDVRLLDELDEREMIEGYFDGKDGWREPGDNRSYSYWHGWRNGASDGHHREIDLAQRELAKSFIFHQRQKKMQESITHSRTDLEGEL
jgi:hypothetical protein